MTGDPRFEWCQRCHVDGMGFELGVGTPMARVEYTNAQKDARVSESFLMSEGWATRRVVNEPGMVRIHASREVSHG